MADDQSTLFDSDNPFQNMLESVLEREVTKEDVAYLLTYRYPYLIVSIAGTGNIALGEEPKQIVTATDGAKDWHWPIQVYDQCLKTSPGDFTYGAFQEATDSGKALEHKPMGTIIRQKWYTAQKMVELMDKKRAELAKNHQLEVGQPLCVEFVDVAEFDFLKDDLDYRFMKFAFQCAAQSLKGSPIQVMNFGLNQDEESHFRQILLLQGKMPRGPEVTQTMPT